MLYHSIVSRKFNLLIAYEFAIINEFFSLIIHKHSLKYRLSKLKR